MGRVPAQGWTATASRLAALEPSLAAASLIPDALPRGERGRQHLAWLYIAHCRACCFSIQGPDQRAFSLCAAGLSRSQPTREPSKSLWRGMACSVTAGGSRDRLCRASMGSAALERRSCVWCYSCDLQSCAQVSSTQPCPTRAVGARSHCALGPCYRSHLKPRVLSLHAAATFE